MIFKKTISNSEIKPDKLNNYSNLSGLILNAIKQNNVELFEMHVDSEPFYKSNLSGDETKNYLFSIAEAQKNNNRKMEYSLCFALELKSVCIEKETNLVTVIPIKNKNFKLYWNHSDLLIKILDFTLLDDTKKDDLRMEMFLNGVFSTLQDNKTMFLSDELSPLISDAFLDSTKRYSQVDMLNENLNDIIEHALSTKDNQLVAYIANKPGVCFKKIELNKIKTLVADFPSLNLLDKIGVAGKLDMFESSELGEIFKGLYLEGNKKAINQKKDDSVFGIMSDFVNNNLLLGSNK